MSIGEFGLDEARYRTIIYMPYLHSYICCMMPVEVKGLQTMGVDKYMRLYYDPDFIKTLTLDEAAFVVLHESMHLLCHDHERSEAILGKEASAAQLRLWNVAADFAINYDLSQAVGRADRHHGERKLPVPESALLPSKSRLPDGLPLEDYYAILLKKAEQIKRDGESGAGGGQGSAKPGGKTMDDAIDEMLDGMGVPRNIGENGGSASDGRERPWENGDPSQSKSPGLDASKQIGIERNTARNIDKFRQECGRGHIPGRLERWTEEILRPKRDPFKMLANAVRMGAAVRRGQGDYTFRKVSRRQPPGKLRLPSAIQPVPNVMVLIDTSGSMGHDDLGLALGTVRQGLASVPAGCIRVMAGDTECDQVQSVFRYQDVKLSGGGGTDVGAIIVDACSKRPRPDLVVAITDGYTPWPENRPANTKVIAALTRAKNNSYPIPSWIDVIEIG